MVKLRMYVKRSYMAFSPSKKSLQYFFLNLLIKQQFLVSHRNTFFTYGFKRHGNALFKTYICSLNHLFVEQIFLEHILQFFLNPAWHAARCLTLEQSEGLQHGKIIPESLMVGLLCCYGFLLGYMYYSNRGLHVTQ